MRRARDITLNLALWGHPTGCSLRILFLETIQIIVQSFHEHNKIFYIIYLKQTERSSSYTRKYLTFLDGMFSSSFSVIARQKKKTIKTKYYSPHTIVIFIFGFAVRRLGNHFKRPLQWCLQSLYF